MVPATYEFSVRSLRNRRLLAAALFAALAVYLLFAIRNYAAYYASAQPDLAHLQRAVHLEPGSSEYWNLLGRYYLLANQDAGQSVAPLRRAISLNPRVAQQWLDLAIAYSILGDSGRQDDALEHAAAADPMMPAVAWDVAVHFLVEGKTEAAWRHLRIAIANDPARREEAFSMALRAGADVNTILRQVMPPDAAAGMALVESLVRRQRIADSIRAWDWLVALHQPVDSKRAYPFVQYLLDRNEPSAAYRVWSDLADTDAALRSYLRENDNLIVNGGFENPILNAGFDWRLAPASHVTLAVDTTIFQSGSRSLSATFDGNTSAQSGLHQFVNVQPNARYRLSGYMRGQAIDGAARPRFVIIDPFTYRMYAATDEIAEGSTFWRKFETDFDVPPDVKEVLATVAPGAPEALVKGTVWVNDVTLVRLPSK